MTRLAIFSAIAWLMLGCAHEPTYAELLAQRSIPVSEEDVQKECTWIRGEIARMQSLSAQAVASQYAALFQAMARDNIAALESRAARIRCGAAFSPQPQKSEIQQCIDACKANTSRTPEQCFDDCNRGR